jgi:heptosyltransferase-2
MRRALVIAPNWIGDALMAQPLFARLVKLHPRMAIDAVAPSWVAPVLERMPEIRDVYATDLAHGKLQMLRRWQLASDLRDVGYDAAYVLPNSLKSALIPWMAGIRLRIGYTGESRIGLLNVRHANPRKDERPPMVGHYAALAYAPGAKIPDDLPMPRLDADLNEAARVSARFNLDTRVPLLVFCPGAEYGPAKRWPPDHYAALARSLHVEHGLPILLLGSGKEAALCEEIAQLAPGACRVLAGQTSLIDAFALIAASRGMVSNDSGLMHVAAAFGLPQVAVYGSTSPLHTPPLNPKARVLWLKKELRLDCMPCFDRTCRFGHTLCLNGVEPARVEAALADSLKTV